MLTKLTRDTRRPEEPWLDWLIRARRHARELNVRYGYAFNTKQITFLQITCVIVWLELKHDRRAAMCDHVFFGNALCVVDPMFLEMHFVLFLEMHHVYDPSYGRLDLRPCGAKSAPRKVTKIY